MEYPHKQKISRTQIRIERYCSAETLGSAALVILSMFMCALLVIYPLADFDTFWHLANGRAMLEQHLLSARRFFLTPLTVLRSRIMRGWRKLFLS